MAAPKKPSKVPKLDTVEDDNVPDGNSDEQQQVLEKAVGIQREIDKLNEQASEEILHVEQKYNKLRVPFFKKRSELLKELPDFWATTLTNNPQLAELLNEEDENALGHLENLTVEEFEDARSGYTITFHFRPNKYFTNEILRKEYTLEQSGETVVGTTIQWTEGNDLTAKKEDKDEGEAGRKRPLEPLPSFFTWFSETEPADEIAECIKDEVWPNPLQFYFGVDDGGGQLEVSLDDELEYDEDEEDDQDDGLDDEEEEVDEVVLSDEDDDEDEV